MREIRKWQEEREAWEAHCSELEWAKETLEWEKAESRQEIARLAEEIQQLKHNSYQNVSSPAPARQPVDPRTAKTHHEQYLELMAQIDALRADLRQEQVRCRGFERRAAEAEAKCSNLTCQLDKTGTSSVRGISERLDVTMPCPEANRIAREMPSEEMMGLEDENLKLREDLNAEKQKNLEFKREAQRRKAAEVRAGEEQFERQKLEAEVARLKLLEARLQQELEASTGREVDAKREVDRLARELAMVCQAKDQSQKTADSRVAELQTLATAVGGQLVAVEQELTDKVRKNSHLFQMFLHHAREPMKKIRRYARDLAAAGPDVQAWSVPPLFDPTISELQDNLVKLVKILRFAANVFEKRHLQAQLHAEYGGS